MIMTAEPTFLIKASDPSAPSALELMARTALTYEGNLPKHDELMHKAEEFRKWQKENTKAEANSS